MTEKILEVVNTKLGNKYQAALQASKFGEERSEILIKCTPNKNNKYKIAKLLDVSPMYLDLDTKGVVINSFDLELVSKQYSFSKYLKD